MSALAEWLASGVLHGSTFFAVAWVLSRTVLRGVHPSARAVLFGLVLLKFLVPTGPALDLSLSSATQAVAQQWTSAPVMTPSSTAAPTGSPPWQQALVASWAVVVMALGVRRALKHRALLRALGPAQPAPEWLRVLARSQRVDAPHVVTHASGPCLVGVVRPVLVLPEGAAGSEREAMVVHELAHLRRHDPLWRALQAVVDTLFFFWPLTRLASRELSLAREQACDLTVVEAGVISRDCYADLLLQLGLESSTALAMAAQPTHLERRITMVLDSKQRRPRWALVAMLGVAGLAGASATHAAVRAPETPAQLVITQLYVAGSLDGRVVSTQFATRRSELAECYRDFLVDHPGVSGTVVLHFSVQTDGTVGEACQSSGTTLPMEVGRCVSDRLMTWQFPMPTSLASAALEYRFDFGSPATGT